MPQTGCTISTTATCLTTGDVSKLACTVAATGYRVVGTGSKATAGKDERGMAVCTDLDLDLDPCPANTSCTDTATGTCIVMQGGTPTMLTRAHNAYV